MSAIIKLFYILFVLIFSVSPVTSSESDVANITNADFGVINHRPRGDYDINMTILMDKQTTPGNKEMFGSFLHLNGSQVLKISLANINPNLSFVIFQVHAHIFPLEVYKGSKEPRVPGQNVGLYSNVQTDKDDFYVANNNRFGLSFYLSVHGYGPNDPIPGGCNMEFSTPIPPFMDIKMNTQYVLVDIAAPMDPSDPNCLKKNPSVTFYVYYQPEFDFDSEKYFDAIKRMLTLEDILANGVEVPGTFWNIRRMLSLYSGTGSVYVAVARSKNGYSIYVPIQTYGCNGETDPLCIVSGDFKTRIFCVCLFAVSAFLCFLAHRFIHATSLVNSFCVTVFLSYIIFSLTCNLSTFTIMMISVVTALAIAFVWSMVWWMLDLPVMIVLMSALNAGFLFSALVYYIMPSDLTILYMGVNFWCLYVLIILLVVLAVLSVGKCSNMLSCTFFGAYGIILAIDIVIGSHMKYILVNFVRRATVPYFNNAVLLPPYQDYDIVLTCLWLVFAITGVVFQYTEDRYSFLFPATPRRQHTNQTVYGTSNERIISRLLTAPTELDNERTPLLP